MPGRGCYRGIRTTRGVFEGGRTAMIGGAERWADWPYGAYSYERAREIRELVEAAEDLLEAYGPEVTISQEPPELDDDLMGRMEEAQAEIEDEIEELRARLEKAEDASGKLEKVLLRRYEEEEGMEE